MIELVVNADDFGLSENINRGVIQAFQQGIVTSASVMANGAAFENALSLAHETSLPVGIHLNLTSGAPVLAPDVVPSLVNKNGRFFPKWKFVVRFVVRKIRHKDIGAELQAQLARIEAAGLRPTHIDSHHHIHCLPGLAGIVRELAEKYDIRRIRRISWPGLISWRCPFASLSQVLLAVLSSICYPASESLSFWGFELMACQNKKKTLLQILGSMNDGLHELMCHPGFFDITDEIDSLYGNKREDELRALCHEFVIRRIGDRNIKLLSDH